MTRWKLFGTDHDFAVWLNDYSAQGWQLTKSGWIRFEFTRGVPSQYVYRYHLIPGRLGSQKRAEYLHLLDGMQVDVLKVYEDSVRAQGAAILRRDAAMGQFELESDLGSRLAYEKRLRRLYSGMAGAMVAVVIGLVVAGFFTVPTIVQSLRQGHNSFSDGLTAGITVGAALAALFFLVFGIYIVTQLVGNSRRVASLEHSHLVHE